MTGFPPGTCDTHMHFYDGRYPTAPTAVLRPPDATVEEYRAVQAELGLERVVVVQPTTYGTDNRCQLDAAAAFGDAARAVVVIDRTIADGDLRRFDELGVRGVRFHMLPGGAVPWGALEPVADRIASFGWHVQLQLNGRELLERMDRIRRLPVDVVIDHVGRFMPPVPVDDPAFRALVELLRDERGWVKLSAPYESSVNGTPDYDDVTRLVDALVAATPDRLLWASNWPHPGQERPPTPAELARLAERWLPDAPTRAKVLVDNPAVLYGFPGADR